MSKPTFKSEEVIQAILDRIVAGESLSSICRDEDFPAAVNFYRWMDDDPDLRNRYARAREERAENWVEELVGIADTEDDPQKARVRIDTRKWVISKMLPKTYGDKVAVTDPDGGPLKIIRETITREGA